MFLGGIGYLAWYKRHVLNKVRPTQTAREMCPDRRGVQIELAFEGGYDPALELATFQSKDRPDEVEHLRRREQDLIDKIIAGKTHGQYFVLLGPKVRYNPAPALISRNSPVAT